ncbi:MAG: T9SS type A sorting domain-containing protein [Bacteroidota bacterium]
MSQKNLNEIKPAVRVGRVALPLIAFATFALLFMFLQETAVETQSSLSFAGKDGTLHVSSDTIINHYTDVVADVSSGDSTIFVRSVRTLNGIGYGDLVMVIQMQGASINTTVTSRQWGAVTSLNNAGNYEYAYVRKADSTDNSLTFCPPLTKDYTASGHVQVVRVPQYTDVTIDNGATIYSSYWNGLSGGIVAMQIEGDLTLNGEISVSGRGFRGGGMENSSSPSGSLVVLDYAQRSASRGGEKGEGIAGFFKEYDTLGGRYGRGAPANGGGGGNGHNAGGGGGANAGALAEWNGYGIMDSTATGHTAWQFDPGYQWTGTYTHSTGGGQGGYTYGAKDKDALTKPPGHPDWSGDRRDTVGGVGGRPIDGYSLSDRIFMGGGGGAGDGNNLANYDAPAGGGIVMIQADNIAGAGGIQANGIDALITQNRGNDGPSGGGAGGTILLDVQQQTSGISMEADGGNGGDQTISTSESEGPGGGGGGGLISLSTSTSSSISKSVKGGEAGTTDCSALTEFPLNGATHGHDGVDNLATTLTIPVINCGMDDADGDGIEDHLDLDADNDGIPDRIENQCSSSLINGYVIATSVPNAMGNESNIIGPLDGSYANFLTHKSKITLELDPQLPAGIPLHLKVKKKVAAGIGTKMRLEISESNSSYQFHASRALNIHNTNGEIVSVVSTSPTTYIRLSQFMDRGDLFDFSVDGAYFSYTEESCEDPDTDQDGIPDYLDLDSDNDGIADIIEAGGADQDGDGRADDVTDTDGDGLVDIFDVNDADGPLVAACRLGGDCDVSGSTSTLFDVDEDGTHDSNGDFDGDGLPNWADLDADGDGLLDIYEVGGTDANSDGQVDYSTPAVASSMLDTDGDGFFDGVDGDVGNDGVAENTGSSYMLSPADTTLDGLPDGAYTMANTDSTGYPDFLDIDADDDGIVDLIEAQETGNYFPPLGQDNDKDGIDDQFDSNNGVYGGNGLTPENTDGEDLPDYRDLDADNDQIPDAIEGHDSDGDEVADDGSSSNRGVAAGWDLDKDGLDDGYDNDSTTFDPTNGNLTPISYPNGGGGDDRDWRSAFNANFPVSWLSFEAKWEGNAGKLSWETASELNSREFQIERKNKGSQAFLAIGSVPSFGTTNQVQSYDFSDEEAFAAAREGVIIYRIKQIDIDGSVDFSNSVELAPKEGNLNVKVFPNPANNRINLQTGLDPSAVGTVEVIAVNGQVIYQGSLSSSQQIDVSSWNAGTYVVIVKAKGQTISKKLSVRH